MKITFLGSGTSHGVPSIDCMQSDFTKCRKNVCKEASNDPKHNRTRSSIVIEHNNNKIEYIVKPKFLSYTFFRIIWMQFFLPSLV